MRSWFFCACILERTHGSIQQLRPEEESWAGPGLGPLRRSPDQRWHHKRPPLRSGECGQEGHLAEKSKRNVQFALVQEQRGWQGLARESTRKKGVWAKTKVCISGGEQARHKLWRAGRGGRLRNAGERRQRCRQAGRKTCPR